MRRRAFAARGCVTGSQRDGSSGMPASNAASARFSVFALWPKYAFDAVSTPYAPLPR